MTRPETLNKPVVRSRPPMGSWSCDSCPTSGDDWQAAADHTATSGHRRFTSTDWDGIRP